MANDVGKIMQREFWETSNDRHKQCIKKLLQLMEAGDIDPKIPGLPSCPKTDRFKYKCLSKWEQTFISSPLPNPVAAFALVHSFFGILWMQVGVV